MARMRRDQIEHLVRQALEGAGTMPNAAASLARAARPRAPRRPKAVFNTAGPVPIYPSSGTGAWEAALSNTL